MDEYFKSNPLYQNVLDYLSKPKSEIPKNQYFQRKRFLRNAILIVSVFFGLMMTIGILGLGLNLIKSNLNSSEELQPVLYNSSKPGINSE